MIVGERERERESDDKLEKLLPGILFFVCTLKHRFRRKKKTTGSWSIFLLQTSVL
jgi:hypothetical protein